MFELDLKAVRAATAQKQMTLQQLAQAAQISPTTAQKQMTLQQLAQAAQISPTTAQKVLHKGKAQAPIVGKLAKALNVDTATILK